ncbi:acetylcholine receptor subunit delta-like [Ruditapes philippinarum]|uniref:acetylcholine receptor subunit delta-like n=1 Tax=Ruditapes philippinarum TaxID=129788 RepID=UPI00295ACB5A|nr:acetylcholine receptor subunit delta-like [Ruditapes philippinarum]
MNRTKILKGQMDVIIFPYRYMLLASYVALTMGANNTTTPMQNLWYDLFVKQGYSTVIRPVYNTSIVTDVSLSLHLKSLNSFDEVSGILSLNAYMFITWYDAFLTWDSPDYDSISLARWPQDPSILLKNAADGTIDWSPMEIFESSCPVDMTYFPYDIQTCELQFMSWSYTDDSVQLYTNRIEYVDLEDFTPNPQWEIISTDIFFANNTPANHVEVLSFQIQMRRKPRYHLSTMFLPIVLLAVLDIFVFILPSDGGEKSGYAVTVFLAFTVFLTIVNSTMPENSENLPIFSMYIIIQTGQSTLITMFSLLSIRIASFDETTRIPCVLAAMSRLVRMIQCKTTCKNRCTTKINKIGNEDECGGDDDSYVDRKDSDYSLENETLTWRHVANAGDLVCFVIFSAAFVISTVVCFCAIERGGR